jgi:membrane protease YdiL (CAAX protease family)
MLLLSVARSILLRVGLPAIPAGLGYAVMLAVLAIGFEWPRRSDSRRWALWSSASRLRERSAAAGPAARGAERSVRTAARQLIGPHGAALGKGAAIGAALLLPGAWLAAHGYPVRGATAIAGAFPSWAVAITAVAIAEEMVLRGALQPIARRAIGPDGAIVLTAALFALIHLPIYGVVALPLDLGVGLVLGVLRQRTGSVSACGVAHVIADLGAWWVA